MNMEGWIVREMEREKKRTGDMFYALMSKHFEEIGVPVNGNRNKKVYIKSATITIPNKGGVK